MVTRFIPKFRTILTTGTLFGINSVLQEEIKKFDSLENGLSSPSGGIYTPCNHMFKSDEINYGMRYVEIWPLFDLQALRASLIIKQAFEDCGVKDPIQVNVFYREWCDLPNASVTSYYDKRFQRRVQIKLILPMITSYSPRTPVVPDGELYAVGGHEAIHHLHRHTQIIPFITGFNYGIIAASTFISYPSFLVRAISVFCQLLFILPYADKFILRKIDYKPLIRLMELDADISSARKLGTGNELMQLLDKYAQKSEDVLYLDKRHPEPNTRIKLLRPFYTQTSIPLLFRENRKDKIYAHAEDTFHKIKSEYYDVESCKMKR